MAKPSLDSPGIVALIGEGVAAGMAEHMRMDGEWNASRDASACSSKPARASQMEKQWRVGDLQTMQGADPRAMTMIGFVLYDETGQPCVTFG